MELARVRVPVQEVHNGLGEEIVAIACHHVPGPLHIDELDSGNVRALGQRRGVSRSLQLGRHGLGFGQDAIE